MPSVPANGLLQQLADYRARTLDALRDWLPEAGEGPFLYGLIHEVLSHAGKGFRPALCLATCGAFGGKLEDALPSAAALELLHNAFLVHDDVEDGSDYRHGRPALYHTHGLPLAVNAGDAMQAISMRLLRRNFPQIGPERALRAMEEFDHLLLRSLEGQAEELGWIRTNRCGFTTADYLRLVLGKTCWYSFIHPCRVGAIAAGHEELDAFNEFGMLLGAAFQIQDDVLNLTAGPAYGKEIGGDLYEGKRTLMLAHLWEHGGPEDRDRLQAILGKPRSRRLPREIHWLQRRLEQHGSIEYARQAAGQLQAAAVRCFDSAYESAGENEHKQFLRQLLSYMVERGA
jgi:geranylgeranyl diphosphate synthase, type II